MYKFLEYTSLYVQFTILLGSKTVLLLSLQIARRAA